MKKNSSTLAILSLLTVISFGQSAIDYYNQGVSNEKAGALADALTNYTKAIELKPDYAAAYYNRGVAKHHKGDSNGAMADYNKAISLWQIEVRLNPSQKPQLQVWIEKAEDAKSHITK